MKKRFLALLPLLGLTACVTPDVDRRDKVVVAQTQANISSVQPIPDLRYSTQRQTLIESYQYMAQEQPFFMIATSNDGKILATAIVKGCVPATFQLTNPESIEINGAVLPQAEINGLFTGQTNATYCTTVDGTFFYLEHLVAVSNKPFPDALTASAVMNFTPNIQVNPDGSLINIKTGETY